MEYSTKESEIGKSLSKFEDNADEDMEEDEDEEDAKFLVEYFKKRFLLKRNRLNNAKNDMPSSDEENDPNSIEQMMG
uniref:Uncharacterized protein n=1 Tax=Panagrolaimus superbus TaxID=310955 RepID=A0A914Y8T4_9BILA